ncbi:hypothetical protein NYR55_12545 [Sphingomonas sp. BGYR3]|uniref:hypothetical protein n=1 Tax=Sphingomonas sp. BGYR3 TaxID=2975483 RepID=UPI0021A3650A|nr:hypothetical protein [Sphingomonas sp. BGYR3]MDG5489445.1 hypothetical protein [Sphingomonas sp. BGYR3]
MTRALLRALATLSLLLALVSAALWWERRTLPMNEAGRHFDGIVVYDDNAPLVYGGMAILLAGLAAVLAILARARH